MPISYPKRKAGYVKRAMIGIFSFIFVFQPFIALAAEGDVVSEPNISESANVVSTSEDPVVAVELVTIELEAPETVPEALSEEESASLLDEALHFSEEDEKELDESGESKVILDPDGGMMAMFGGGGPSVPEPGFKNGPSFADAQRNKLAVDKQNGSMTYEYHLNIPEGRNGMTPDLVLQYSSQARNMDQNWFGRGWNVSIPKIERMTRMGTNNIYTTSRFQSSIAGDLSFLGGTEYGARTEKGDFTKYFFSNNIWTAYTKDGLTYTYGATHTERFTNPLHENTIFAWYLSEIRDKNGNFITYKYTKSLGQIYPDYITYTNAAGVTGIYKVTFNLGSRTDLSPSYRTGFAVTTSQIITNIEIRSQNTLRRKYDLSYSLGDNTTTKMLASVTETGYDSGGGSALSLPATAFVYSKHQSSWTKNPDINKWKYPGFSDTQNQYGRAIQYVDINGDGLTDILTSRFNWEQYSWNGSTYVPLSTSSVMYTMRTLLNTGTSWIDTSTYDVPVPFLDWMGRDYGLRLMDINGDGLMDIICSGPNKWIGDTGGNYSLYTYVFINNGNGFTRDTTTYFFPTNFIKTDFTDNGVRISDVNGDGLVDLLLSTGTNDWGVPLGLQTYLNPGTGYWSTTSSWTLPAPIFKWHSSGSSYWNHPNVFFVDLNGDGLQDILWESIYALEFATGAYNVYGKEYRAYLNTGFGWIKNDVYAAPTLLTTSVFWDFTTNPTNLVTSNGSALVDVNADGLTDIMHTKITWLKTDVSQTTTTVNSVWLNTIKGWVASTVTSTVDLVQKAGTGSGSNPDLQADNGVRVSDFDGDGIPDIVSQMTTSTHLGLTGWADVANKITVPTGAASDIYYKTVGMLGGAGSSTSMNPAMPSSQINAVQQIVTKDAGSVVGSTTHNYEGGINYFDPSLRFDRIFAGFSKVTETTSSSKRTAFYHQGNSSDSGQGEYLDSYGKIGQMYRSETRGSDDRLFASEITKWEQTTSSVDGSEPRKRFFVWPKQSVVMTYGAGSAHRDTAKLEAFDSVGNVSSRTLYGEVTGSQDGTFSDTGSDSRLFTFEYATTTSSTKSGLLFRQTESNGGGTSRVTETIYDGLTLGTVSYGNPTKVTVRDGGATQNIVTHWSYDTLGLPVQKVDPRGATSTWSYESTKMRMATSTNPLSQQTHYYWDLGIGSVSKIIDPNGLTQRGTYDSLGRLVDTYGPNTFGAETQLSSNAYVDTPGSLSFTQTNWIATGSTTVQKVYADGLGREIQSRKLWPGGQYNTRDTVYNQQGGVAWNSLPYLSSGSSKTSATTNPSLQVSYQYDALDRAVTTTDILGTSLNLYDRWNTDVVDRLGRVKTFERDAYGQLIGVTERNSGQTYDTDYSYDWSGNLTQITDSQANIRSLTYDIFGRRLQISDLHSATDTHFSVESYAYDTNSNLVTSTRPGGFTIVNSYDALNRLTQKSINGATAETYTYDSCTRGKGKLCQESSLDYSRTNDYDFAGRLTTTTLQYASNNYVSSKQYKLNGGLGGYVAPDGQRVTYGYESDKIVSVTSQESGQSPVTLASSISYHPSGLASTIQYGNGASTVNTYDTNALYRLTNKVTTASTTVQSLSYAYDVMGNMTSSTESVGPTARNSVYAYDGLDRLLSTTSTSPTGTLLFAEHYAYDRLGDILSRTSVGTSTIVSTYSYNHGTGSYSNPHAVTGIETRDNGALVSTQSFEYDLRGNPATTTLRDNGGQVIPESVRVLSWNAEDQMTGLVIGSGTSSRALSYLYGVGGDRIRQSETASTSILYVSPEYNAMFDASSTQVDVEKHVSVGAQAIATIQGTGGAARALFSHTDHLSGASVVTDASGAVEERIDYLPYGSIRSDEKAGTWSEQRKFAGHEFDDKSGYSYMQARYYDPVVGRFLSVDPAFRDLSFRLEDPQSMNSYAYARNNPLKYIDSDGRLAQLLPMLLAAGLLYGPMAGLAADNPALIAESGLRTAPVSGDLIDAREAYTGRDAFTGEGLSAFERGITLVGAAAPMVPGKALRAGSKVVKEGAEAVQGVGAKISKALPKIGSYGGPGAGKRFSQGTRDAVYSQNSKCVFCSVETVRDEGNISTQYNTDHAWSRKNGGNNSLENAQTTCRDCNLSKGSKNTAEYMSSEKFSKRKK